ncbi:hypothetical protein VPH35_116711 [Triticum aestivum]
MENRVVSQRTGKDMSIVDDRGIILKQNRVLPAVEHGQEAHQLATESNSDPPLPETQDTKDIPIRADQNPGDSFSETSAPPGFSQPIYLPYLQPPESSTTLNSPDFPLEELLVIIQVPMEWVNFLSITFLTPDKFEWAQKFIKSQVWEIIAQNKEIKNCLPFAIPESCPDSNSENTPSAKGDSQEISASSTSALHQNWKRKEKGPLVETEVRRSCRLQQLQKGFKKSVCMDKDCLACHSLTPSIPTKVIKNLNTSFRKVNAQNTSEEKLSNIPKKAKTNSKPKEGNMVPKGGSKSKESSMVSKGTSKTLN